MNFVEMIASSLLFLLIGGLHCPLCASGFGVLMIISRIFYAVGYVKKGPKGRLVGALLNDIALLGLFILGVMAAWSLIKVGCQSHAETPKAQDL